MTLREKIIQKYGTVKRFAEIVKLDEKKIEYAIQNKLRSRIAHYVELIEAFDDKVLPGEFPRELIDQIRGQIMFKYNRQKNFCDKYGFTEAYISDLLNGKYYRITPRFERVCKILDIKTTFICECGARKRDDSKYCDSCNKNNSI